MKKVIVLAVSAVLCVGLGFTAVNAATSEVPERGYASVSASANKELTPDTAEISISVRTYDNRSMQKATVQNKEISDKVYSALKEMINPENKDYVKTSNFHANPVYIYSGNKRSIDKYEVSNTIIVHTKSITKVGDMIDKAIALGATDVSNMTFSVSGYEDECDALLALATKKARNQADILVKGAGSAITGLKTISGSCSPSPSTRVRAYAKTNFADSAALSAEAAGPSTPIEVGVVKIYANVSASFFVK